MLDDILKRVQRGQHPDYPWKLFYLTAYPGSSEPQARRFILQWGKKHGVLVKFQTRKVSIGSHVTDTEFVCFERG